MCSVSPSLAHGRPDSENTASSNKIVAGGHDNTNIEGEVEKTNISKRQCNYDYEINNFITLKDMEAERVTSDCICKILDLHKNKNEVVFFYNFTDRSFVKVEAVYKQIMNHHTGEEKAGSWKAPVKTEYQPRTLL